MLQGIGTCAAPPDEASHILACPHIFTASGACIRQFHAVCEVSLFERTIDEQHHPISSRGVSGNLCEACMFHHL